jgi:uncharacterized repeat protein (TIGR03803 family)
VRARAAIIGCRATWRYSDPSPAVSRFASLDLASRVLIIPGISIAEVAITNARPAAFPDAERDVLLLQDADHARDSDVVEVRIGRVAEEASAAGIPDGRGERFTTNCLYNINKSCGTVFKITPSGTLTTLHSFSFTDGSSPQAGVIQGTDGNLYGTTTYGGANCISARQLVGCGTIFKITLTGTLTTLYKFNSTNGYPFSGLVQGTDLNFYGTSCPKLTAPRYFIRAGAPPQSPRGVITPAPPSFSGCRR